MKKTKLSLIVLLTMAAFLVPNSFAEIYELRTYTSHEGKLESVLNRFENHTMSLFEKHGIRNVGYWVSEDQDNTLIYIVAHESRIKQNSPGRAACLTRNGKKRAQPLWLKDRSSTKSKVFT